MMEQRAKGRDIYLVHNFGKSWYLTLMIFVAEVLALIFYQISIRLQPKTSETAIYGNLRVLEEAKEVPLDRNSDRQR
jgi:hypothetical protein